MAFFFSLRTSLTVKARATYQKAEMLPSGSDPDHDADPHHDADPNHKPQPCSMIRMPPGLLAVAIPAHFVVAFVSAKSCISVKRKASADTETESIFLSLGLNYPRCYWRFPSFRIRMHADWCHSMHSAFGHRASASVLSPIRPSRLSLGEPT